MIALLKRLLCRHAYGDWRPAARDEIGGVSLERRCAKCQSRQVVFNANTSPLAE